VSLQYYPHEDLELKSTLHPGGGEAGAGDYVAVAIIDMVLATALVSFAVNGGVVGTIVLLGLIAGFNLLALRGRR
jgi:hypothetical protein